MGQVYHWWWRPWREINVLSRLEYNMLHVLYLFVTYLLTLPCMHVTKRLPGRILSCELLQHTLWITSKLYNPISKCEQRSWAVCNITDECVTRLRDVSDYLSA
jgi:hypothetical protein